MVTILVLVLMVVMIWYIWYIFPQTAGLFEGPRDRTAHHDRENAGVLAMDG